MWSSPYTGTGSIAVGGLGTDQFGNLVIAGSFSGTVSFGPGEIVSSSTASGAGASLFVAKLPAAGGTALWAKVFDGQQNLNTQSATSVAVDSAGNVIVGGYVNQGVTFGSNNLTTGGFVVKLDPSGNVMWSSGVSTNCAGICGGGSGDGGYVGVAVDSLGNVIAGSTYSQFVLDGGLHETLGFNLTKYSSSGTQTWQNTYSSGTSGFASVAVTADGDVLSSGVFGPSINLGAGALTTASSATFLGSFSAAGQNQGSTAIGASGPAALTSIAATPAGNLAFLASHAGTSTFGTGTLTALGPVDFVVGVIAP